MGVRVLENFPLPFDLVIQRWGDLSKILSFSSFFLTFNRKFSRRGREQRWGEAERRGSFKHQLLAERNKAESYNNHPSLSPPAQLQFSSTMYVCHLL